MTSINVAPPFDCTRLRVARQRLGISLTKLAEESGVSLRSLSSYENGRKAPTDASLTKLAKALAVPPEFFEREMIETIPVETVSFRKLTRTTATRRDSVLAAASLTVEFFEFVESRFRLPQPDLPTLEKANPEQAAEMLRCEWDLSDRPIANVLHLLEAKGVRVAALKHEHRDVDAFCFIRDCVPYVLLNTGKTAERQRFDLAHELGHLVLHADDEMDPANSKQRETEANRFASAFLMPRTGVSAQAMASASLERVLAARSYWKVSAMAMTHRLHELKLLSDWQYRAMCITLSDLGYRSSEPGGQVPETSQLLRKVMFGADQRITPREAAKHLRLNPIDIQQFVTGLVPAVV